MTASPTATTPTSTLDPALVEKARELVAAMTLEEKASVTSGLNFWETKAVDSVGVPSITVTDGPHGLRLQVAEADHLGINDSVPATCFPPAAALGSTWDPEIIHEVGQALGEETAANNVAVILGPGVNIKRSPLCGRNFEYFSEDPLLAGAIATAIINGIQTKGVGTSIKHYAANNQETDRMRVDALVDERTLREIYLPAFETAVRNAQPWTVMCSYNRLNGTYASQHPWLLTKVLRDDWDFQGLVVSDWGAVSERVPALAAGLDLEMPSSGGRTDAEIIAAVKAGELDEKILDLAALRNVILALRAQNDTAAAITEFDSDAHHALARRAAAAGAVLLRNEKAGDTGTPTLPLEAGAFSGNNPLAVIGEFARTPRYQGAGSSQINPTVLDSALDHLRAALGEESVVYSPGFHLAEASAVQEEDGTTSQSAAELRAAAVEAATGRTAVLFLGLPAKDESEGYDRAHMDLPEDQVALLKAVSVAAQRTIVLLANGSAVTVEPWEEATDALLECWLGGQAGGSAVADLLLGVAAPGGRLAESIPADIAHIPAQLNFPGSNGQVRYGEGIFVGYRGLDAMKVPLAHPFGSGLTYTTFTIDHVAVPQFIDTTESVDGDTVATIKARVTNTGGRDGDEVVQVYVGRVGASVVERAPRNLAAFEKVHVPAGGSVEVELPLTRRALSYWDVPSQKWVVEAGTWEVSVGSHSRDLANVVGVEVSAPDPVLVLNMDSTLGEWLSHPRGREILQQEASSLVALADDPKLGEMMLAIPLVRLGSFPGSDLSPTKLAGLLATIDQ
ncbi:MAG: glycoside hydrolase family 3 N-terminal domain-containing protein [Actinomycetaceae bacterium]|nr:glycoside hydrolase family 3 N-terminal domain-containing protein [Actinomycetaceae bacterium]